MFHEKGSYMKVVLEAKSIHCACVIGPSIYPNLSMDLCAQYDYARFTGFWYFWGSFSIELACALYGNGSDTVDLWSMIRAPWTLYGNSSLLNVWHMIGQQAYLSMSTRVVHYFIFFVNFIILLSSACVFSLKAKVDTSFLYTGTAH